MKRRWTERGERKQGREGQNKGKGNEEGGQEAAQRYVL